MKIKVTRKHYSPPLFFQQGFATLTVAVTILFLATFVTLYAARIGVMAQRISANEFRAEQAFTVTEAGVEEGIAYLRGSKKQINLWHWKECKHGDVDSPCSNIAENRDHWLFIKDVDRTDPNYSTKFNKDYGSYSLNFLKYTTAPVFLVVAEGKSADKSGQALVRQGVYLYPHIPGAPLMVRGNVDLGGHFSIDTHGEASLSVWARDKVTLDGNAHFTDPILDQDPNFPADLFEYVFGVPGTAQQTVKDKAAILLDCGSLDTHSSGLYWIEGDCTINSSGGIGSEDAPVLLILKGNIRLNGHRQIYGLIFSFPDSSGRSTVQFNGNATVHGAMIANESISHGNFKVSYESAVLKTLYSNLKNQDNLGHWELALISGSWADY